MDRRMLNDVQWLGIAPQKNGSDQVIGRSRGGLTTKVHACVDALGNLVRLVLRTGQVADVTQGGTLVEAIPTGAPIAGKSYDSDVLVNSIEAAGAEVITRLLCRSHCDLFPGNRHAFRWPS